MDRANPITKEILEAQFAMEMHLLERIRGEGELEALRLLSEYCSSGQEDEARYRLACMIALDAKGSVRAAFIQAFKLGAFDGLVAAATAYMFRVEWHRHRRSVEQGT